jgi:hypothetical protein
MRKELPVVLVNKVVDPKRIIGQKMEGRGGGEAQGVADPKKKNKKKIKENCSFFRPKSDIL